MASNYVQPGDHVTLTAPYTVAAGAAALVGGLLGIALNDVTSGAAGEFARTGIWDVAKVSAQAWAQGDRIYWDNSAKLFTTVDTGNTFAGIAMATAANPTSTGRLCLMPTAGARGTLVVSSALDFASINAAASADLTITVTGAVANDPVILGLPTAPAAGLVFFAFVSAADTVTVRAMNITGSPVDAASATYTVAVLK